VEGSELSALLRRRWVVLVPMLVLTFVGVAGAWAKIHAQYESQVQLTMINAPKVTNEPGNDGNPFLAFDTTLGVDVDFLARNITSGASAQQLASLGVTEQYTAAIATNALGPFMQLTVTGSNKQLVTQAMQVLITFTEQRWKQLQKASSAPTNSIIGMSEIAPPSAPSPVTKRKMEAVAGVAVVGLVLSIIVTVAADGIARRRTMRRRLMEAEGIIPRRSIRAQRPWGPARDEEPIHQRSPGR
jgi:uncharacterized protein involved in exopolysaccharide biosynthesis